MEQPVGPGGGGVVGWALGMVGLTVLKGKILPVYQGFPDQERAPTLGCWSLGC